MKPDPFTPGELEPILKAASECGMILVGGQAVNSWAVLLENPESEPWKSLRPYTSKDADMICSEIQMLKLAKALSDSGWEVAVFAPQGREKNLNVGAIRIEGMIAGKRRFVEINLLRQLDGVSIQEINENKEDIPIKDHTIKVIDCLRLLESKTISLDTLDQGQRQDRKHLVLCCAALREILREGAKSPETSGLIATANRVVHNAEHQLGLDTLKHHGVDLLDSIPWETWGESKHPELRAFAGQEETIRAGIQEKIVEAAALKRWLASLNPKAPPGDIT
jgi:hypothetical protein